jgi:hypothetical protein
MTTSNFAEKDISNDEKLQKNETLSLVGWLLSSQWIDETCLNFPQNGSNDNNHE